MIRAGIRATARATRLALLALIAVALVAACGGGDGAAGEPLTGDGTVVFTDVAAEIGIVATSGVFSDGPAADPVAMMGGGLCWLDYDADGWMDLFVVNSFSEAEAGRLTSEGMLPQSSLFHNEEGTFTDVSAETEADIAVRGNGCVAADLDGDGWTDLYVTTARDNVLLWNEGGDGFVDGTEAAGVGAYGWHTGAAAGDVNGDGHLDLFVSGYVDTNSPVESPTGGFPNTHVAVPDLLYLNDGAPGDGRPAFTDVAAEVGIESNGHEYGLGAVLTDVDGDGDLDLYVANDTQPNRLYEAVIGDDVGSGRGFEMRDVSVAVGVDDDNSGMGIASGDYDGTGTFDFFVTNFGRQTHTMFANMSDGAPLAFDDTTAQFGTAEDVGVGVTGWGTSWGDFDVDGDLDLIVANGNVPVLDLAADAEPLEYFTNGLIGDATGGGQGTEGATFEDTSGPAGLGAVGTLNGRATAVADFDNDGDLDVAVSEIAGPVRLLRNDGASGNWLVVEPEGLVPGTVVTVTPPGGGVMRRELHAGGSYLSGEDPRLFFGLGDSGAPDVSVEVVWPDGRTVATDDVAMNQILEVDR